METKIPQEIKRNAASLREKKTVHIILRLQVALTKLFLQVPS